MRKHFLQDFTQIYHIDLHGNVRKNPKLSGTTHNIFGIQVGVGITIAVRNSASIGRQLYYYRVPEYWRKTEKLEFLRRKQSLMQIEWKELKPDTRYNWLTENLHSEFITFFPMGKKNGKIGTGGDIKSIFKLYSLGAFTGRDSSIYDFNHLSLQQRVTQFIQDYNGEVFRWATSGQSKDVDSFVSYDKIKWSRNLKRDLINGRYAKFDVKMIRKALYRPFTRKWLYFADLLVDELGKFGTFFPTSATEAENVVVCATGLGADHQTFFAANTIVDVKCGINGNSTIQCFPYYTYAADGSNRRENITDWALQQFQQKYGEGVSKWDIFHYVYGMLHHPQYRERYAENLKRDLPHIPLLSRPEAFELCVRVGRQLMDLHLHYEQAREYPLRWVESEGVPFSWRVQKMRLTPDHTALVVNESLTLAGVPPECFAYRLGNRSALEWLIDQYQVSRDKRSGIESDPNPTDDEQQDYIVRLVGRVITVSVETVKLVGELAGGVQVEDWLG